MSATNPNIFYNLGKRDVLMHLFMELKERNDREVLREFAAKLIDLDQETPQQNASWYLKHKPL